MEWTPFAEVAGVLAVAAAVAAVGLKLRQPLIISFLFAGILVGPSAIGLVKDVHQIELLASIGISLLLFVVGLRLDVAMIRTVGPVALATGLGQVGFTSLVGFLIALAFGMQVVTAVYVAVALTFSSTIIIVKLLSDKKEIDSLHGRIAVEFWVRNLERDQYAFWLQTSTDKFYPDFVAKLKDGRFLAVEYKGSHLETSADTEEKDAIGQLWAARSKGQCAFLLATKKNLQESLSTAMRGASLE